MTAQVGKPASSAEERRRNSSQNDDDASALAVGIAELEKEFGQMKERIMDLGSRTTDQVRDQFGESIEALRSELEKLSDQAARQGRKTAAKAEQAVQDKPLLFILLSFLLGVFVAHLSSRR